MSKIYQAVYQFLQAFSEQPLIIAYSGGVDSQVLLHVVHQMKKSATITNELSVCHVNHGLSPNAQAWQSFAQKQCAEINTPFLPLSVALDLSQGQSVEALARDARYQALISVSSLPAVILTGHHLDDQAETFILAMKRGAGVKGLSCMHDVSELAQHVLARPLLGISRDEIVAFAQEHHLDWIEDESNQDSKYDRNFLRNEIIPELVGRWPSIAATINRSAQHCQQSQTLLDELAEIDYQACFDKHDASVLHIPPLMLLSEARFNNVFRYFLNKLGCTMPSAAQLTQIKLQMLADTQQTPTVIWGEYACRRYQNKCFITPKFEDISSHEFLLSIKGGAFSDLGIDSKTSPLSHLIELPNRLGTLHLSLANSDAGSVSSAVNNEHVFDDIDVMAKQVIALSSDTSLIKVAFKHANPKVLPDFRQHHRPLKKVLQELNIPVWQRKRIPLIFINDELAAVIGKFTCQPFLPSKKALNLTLRWLKYNKSR